jgi:membrane-associated phospholipid phosphatase
MMQKFTFDLKVLSLYDVIVIAFGIFLTLINFMFAHKIEFWLTHTIVNICTIFLIYLIAWYDKYKPSVLSTQLHYWYLVPIIFLSFKEVYYMVDPIHGIIYDQALIDIDRFLLGYDPTVELYAIANPVLTEILQIIYGTFYFLPIILGVNLLLENKDDEFMFQASAVMLGFFLSYVGYLIIPAIGPRFTLHDFELNNLEMPGIFLTNYLREIVNSGESIPLGTLNPALVVQRDCFPSGHTLVTLIVMYLSVKFKVCTKYVMLPVGVLLIFSTVYLRYHYVIDLIAGALFMIFTIWCTLKVYNWWADYKGKKDFTYK